MNLKTKFNIGEQVYIIRSKSETYHYSCPLCNGTGKVHIQENGDEIDCPSCKGNGDNIGIDTSLFKEQCNVNRIGTITQGDETKIVYSLVMGNGNVIELTEDMVFSSKDADKQIKTNNKDVVFRTSQDLINTISPFNNGVTAAILDRISDDTVDTVAPAPRKKLF